MRNLVWTVVVIALLAVGGIGLARALEGLDLGPSNATPASSASAGTAPATPTPTPSPTRSLSRFDPAASSAENLGVFTRTMEGAARSASSSDVNAATLTDALAAAGFTAIQRSADRTSANLPAPVLTVSARVGGECLVGQFVRSDASVATEIAAPLAQGTCLIGRQPSA